VEAPLERRNLSGRERWACGFNDAQSELLKLGTVDGHVEKVLEAVKSL